MFARTARFGIALVAMRAEYSPSTLELMEAAMKQAEELHAEHKSLKQTLEAAVNKSDELLARHAAALNALSSQTTIMLQQYWWGGSASSLGRTEVSVGIYGVIEAHLV